MVNSSLQIQPRLSLIAGFIFLFIPYIAYSADYLISPPPKSLDKFYLEREKTSEWVEQMRHINKSFREASLYIEENNWEQALESVKEFASAYQKAAEMVPEWKDLFDLEASKGFITHVRSKNAEKTTQLSTQLEKTCTQCHQKHNISVWVRYHWPSTQTIKILDPLDEKELSYEKYMHQLSNSFQNIEVYFAQEKYNETWKAIDIFSKRFTSLRSVCSKCHVTEWTRNSTTVKDFFVGEDIIDALQEIKKTIASGAPDEKLFQKKVEYISKQSCKMCHLVHQPPAIIQRSWDNKP